MVPHQLADAREPRLAQVAHRSPEGEDSLVRELVVDVETGAACRDQAGAPKGLQVTGGVGDAHRGEARQRLDRAFTLGEKVHQLEAPGARHRLGDPGKLVVDLAGQVFC